MDVFIWILQGIVAFIFLFSGANKALLDEKTLVAKGQTGVEGLHPAFIKFIGVSEILGAFGVILPVLLGIYPILTPISAICLGLIMIPAGAIHFRRREYGVIGVNIGIAVTCAVIAWFWLIG